MIILQTATFIKSVKKLHANQKQDLDKAVKLLSKNPSIGQLKTANLSGIRVYKFRMIAQLTLLAYLFNEKESSITLLALGSHENFYRDLSKK